MMSSTSPETTNSPNAGSPTAGSPMTRSGRRARRPREETATDLRQRIAGLMEAIDSGQDYLPGDEVGAARDVLSRGAARLGFTGAHTVVALAGATGSGKSSLFNRMVGHEVSTVGELRPTTSAITAAVWGHDDATALLDWVGVAGRYYVTRPRRARPDDAIDLDGLVLLDLPDVDSDVAAHRAEADRVLAQCDVFVWVTDPQKYADSVLHDDYLRAARHHQRVTLVVLNQADRMRSDQAKACRDDLRRLLMADGLPEAEVLLVSARTGEGLEELAVALGGAAKAASAARERLLADVEHEAARLSAYVGDDEPELPGVDEGLIDALARTAGLPVALNGVEAQYRRVGTARTGWLFGRWVARLRPDPLTMLGLHLTTPALGGGAAGDSRDEAAPGGAGKSKGRARRRKRAADRSSAGAPGRGAPDGTGAGGAADLPAVLRRTSLPQATPASRAAVELMTRRLGQRASAGLPLRWADAVVDAATPREGPLASALDRAVVGTPLIEKTPVWWHLANAVQWLSGLAVVGGLGWLATLLVLALLQFPAPPTPRLGPVLPVPTALVVAGLVLGVVLAALCRPLVARGARRRRRRIETRLRQQIVGVAQAELIGPVGAVLDAHRRTRTALSTARGR